MGHLAEESGCLGNHFHEGILDFFLSSHVQDKENDLFLYSVKKTFFSFENGTFSQVMMRNLCNKH